ncbi:MAG: hypothetical protein RMA76_07635 [Deltaproteobacteria bacterium]|jgi:hypothetical protein
MWTWVLAAVVTSTTTATSSVADPVEDAPGAARVERAPPLSPPEAPPTPPAPKVPESPAVTSMPEPVASRLRTSEVLVRLVSQPNGINADRALAAELAAAFWVTERFGVEGRVAYAPLLYDFADQAFTGLGTFSTIGYASAGMRGSFARGAGRVFGRWSTTIDAYACLGLGGFLQDGTSSNRVALTINGGLGFAMDLFGPGVALSLEVTDAFYPLDAVPEPGNPDAGSHELRLIGGLAFSLNPDVYDAADSTPPDRRPNGWRIGLLASNTVDQSYDNGSPGVAATFAIPIASRVHAEVFAGIFTGRQSTRVPFEGETTVVFPVNLTATALEYATTLGVQVDVVRADVPSIVGDDPSAFRVYGIAGLGVGTVVNDDPLHVVGAVGAGFELAFPVGLIVAADFRDLLYTEGFSLSHLRTGVLLGWRFGG